jgi:hypothetical protein
MRDTFNQYLRPDAAVFGIGRAPCPLELVIILEVLAAHRAANSVCPFCALTMWILIGLNDI